MIQIIHFLEEVQITRSINLHYIYIYDLEFNWF